MPRYFFDVHNGSRHDGFERDEEGTDCSDFEAARVQAMATLPEIGRREIPRDGDQQAFTVLVRNETGSIVCTATLTLAGLRLNGEARWKPAQAVTDSLSTSAMVTRLSA